MLFLVGSVAAWSSVSREAELSSARNSFSLFGKREREIISFSQSTMHFSDKILKASREDANLLGKPTLEPRSFHCEQFFASFTPRAGLHMVHANQHSSMIVYETKKLPDWRQNMDVKTMCVRGIMGGKD